MVKTSSDKVQDIAQAIERYSAHHYARVSGAVFHSAQGVWLIDVRGKKYLDMHATYSTVSIGHNHPRIKHVLAQNLPMLSHSYYTEQETPFLRELCEISGMGGALLMSTGAEAVETALKLARKWGYVRKGIPENEAEIIVAAENFHGRTITIISFSTEERYRKDFGPSTPGFRVVPYGDAQALESAMNSHTAAVLLEPIQGEGGVNIPSPGYLAAVKTACAKHHVLLMLDEVQTGLARTGRTFAFEHERIRPDVLILGKALGGGMYPVSAVLAQRRTMNLFGEGEHGSTWGGNAFACAIGFEALRIMQEEELAKRSRELGTYFLEQLRAIHSPLIREVRGKGLLVGIELTDVAGHARKWCERLLASKHMVTMNARTHVVRLSPPLMIDKPQLDTFLSAWEETLREKERGEW